VTVARLARVTHNVMLDYLSRSANFVKFDARKKKQRRCDPPEKVSQVILSRDGEWPFPRLAGVITTPTLRPDGSILSEPGYDPATQLLLVEGLELPDIAPTKDNAVRAA